MKFLVTATPSQVPLLDLGTLRRVGDWHTEHAASGCMVTVLATGCLAGILEAESPAALHLLLASYPDRNCYTWEVQAVQPMAERCAQEVRARTTLRKGRPLKPQLEGSVFPAWMNLPPA